MVKQRLKNIQLLFLAFLVSLAACSSQPSMQEDESVTATNDSMDKIEASAQEKAARKEKESNSLKQSQQQKSTVEVKKEPEPPTVEIIPRKDLGEPKIALEPLPADQEVIEGGIESKEVKAATGMGVETKPAAVDVQEVPQQQTAKPESGKADALLAKITPPATPITDKAPVPPQPVEIPSDPNTFVITVGPKSAPHPAMGKGHKMGFLVNGTSGKELVLERGKTYTFQIETDPKHDVYLSTKAIGWGAAPIAEGVEGAYTYKGTMTFTPSDNTPNQVYYSCRNHPYMGAVIHVVNPGEGDKVVLQQQSAPATAGSSTVQSTSPTVSDAAVKQKLMFAEMMMNAQSAKRVMASQNDEAKQLLANAKEFLATGRAKSQAGANSEALALADSALSSMGEAAKLVPSEEALAQLAENYKALLAEIKDYEKSYQTNLARMEKTESVPEDALFDQQKVAKMKSDAQSLADKNNYVRANEMLGEVQHIVTNALQKMLHSKTIVYDLNFETAADEYEYELKRFTGYEELIPIAIEAKKPAPGAVKLMQSFVDKARKRRDQAVEKANAGEYGDAIAMLHQATKTVRRALRMVGVMQ